MLTVDENKTSKKNDQPISRCFAEPSSLPKDKHHHHSRKTYGTINQDEAQPSDSIRTEAQTEYLNETTPIDPAVYRGVMRAMPALAIGIFLASADQTIVVSSYGRIGSELRALNQTSWIATSYASPSGLWHGELLVLMFLDSYLLTQTSFQPLYGKLTEIFGRKPMLLVAFGVFGLGTLLCGFARTMNELLVARAIAGIGGGGMTTLVAIVLSAVIPLNKRGIWQGYNNIVFATGLGIGAPLGGYFSDTMGWRL